MNRDRHRPVRALLIAGTLAAAPLIAACSSADNEPAAPATPTNSTIVFSMPSTTAQVPNPDTQISAAAAKQLCDMMRPDIDKWHSEGAAVGRVAFNGTVHNWAAR